MSLTPVNDDAETGSEDSDDPVIPEGVLRGIEDVNAEDTASKEDLEAIFDS